jgi:hypothetical protein
MIRRLLIVSILITSASITSCSPASTSSNATTTISPARPCGDDSAATQPITVAVAFGCPAGSAVWVTGVEIRYPEGSKLLCDTISKTPPVACVGQGLLMNYPAGTDEASAGSEVAGLHGTVTNGVLTVRAEPGASASTTPAPVSS